MNIPFGSIIRPKIATRKAKARSFYSHGLKKYLRTGIIRDMEVGALERREQPIGIFDSGLGGISVLAEALHLLPSENYLYYGDSLHIPYGDKQPEEVLILTRHAVKKLIDMGCKAIVIACNTATSVAAETLRQEFTLPIIGMEPALKPASLLSGDGHVLVMATHMTLSQPKFQRLMQEYGKNAIPISCSGLMEIVEDGEMTGPQLVKHLDALLSPHMDKPIKAVVLGCTHYVFLKKAIACFLGPNIPLVDGNQGTVLQLKRKLKQNDLLRTDMPHEGNVTFCTSALEPQAEMEKMNRMLQRLLQLHQA